MSITVLRDQRIFIDGHELTTKSNSCSIEATKDTPDATTFASEWRQRMGDGIKDLIIGIGGYMEIGDDEEYLFDELDSSQFCLTITAATQEVGGLAWHMKAIESSLSILGSVGEVAPFQIGAGGQSAMARGYILSLADTAVTADGNGTGIQISGASTGQTVSFALQIPVVSGTSPTLSVILESAATSGFSSVTTLYTTEAFNSIGTEYVEIALPNTNTHFRVRFDVGGTTPSFKVLSSIAII